MSRGLRTSDYDFALPPERIAQTPTARRDESRLMVVARASGSITHHAFTDVAQYLHAGDALVLNTTRVFKARLLGTRDSGAPAEVLLLKEDTHGMWEAMVQPGNKLKPGRTVTFSESFWAEMGEPTARGTRLVKLIVDGASAGDRDAERLAIAAHGHVPLPPYIGHTPDAGDEARYQTVYAKNPGAVAAPTAGLHFDDAILGALREKGVGVETLTLHVGAGTFQPVRVQDHAEHRMHSEWYSLPQATVAALAATRAAGGRVVAVGTTSLRALESAAAAGEPVAGAAETTLFVLPGYRFRIVDRLVTNFHLSRSTLLMLVSAFGGIEHIRAAYRHAIAQRYRFFSYGDAMLIDRAPGK